MDRRRKFIDLLVKATETRDTAFGIDINGLIEHLDRTDFFIAPATTKYSYCYDGGLCDHSIALYEVLSKLNSMLVNPYPEDTIIIVALLHDLYKADYYESYVTNKKIYCEDGNKYDEMGRYKWVSEKAFKVKDASSRLLIGTGGVHSYMLISSFVTLTNDEVIALVNHPIGLDASSYHSDLPHILQRCNLVALLHSAEVLSNYCYGNIKDEL